LTKDGYLSYNYRTTRLVEKFNVLLINMEIVSGIALTLVLAVVLIIVVEGWIILGKTVWLHIAYRATEKSGKTEHLRRKFNEELLWRVELVISDRYMLMSFIDVVLWPIAVLLEIIACAIAVVIDYRKSLSEVEPFTGYEREVYKQKKRRKSKK